MKRIYTLIVVLLSASFTACRQATPSGMEKAFGCEVGNTTYEEFCRLYPEDSYEWGLSWTSPGNEYLGIQPEEVLSIILKEGSYRGTACQQIGMSFDNGVLSDITFHVNGTADEIDTLIAFFREEFSQYHKYEVEEPTSGEGISHHQIFFDDGLTTLMLWKRDYSQCEPREFAQPTDISLEISIVDNNDKTMMDYLSIIRIKRSKKRK